MLRITPFKFFSLHLEFLRFLQNLSSQHFPLCSFGSVISHILRLHMAFPRVYTEH